MEHLILSTSEANHLIELLPNSKEINLNDFQPNSDGYSTLRQISGQDVLPHHIAKKLNELLQFENFKSITIDLTTIPLSLGVLLGVHLRFLQGTKFSGPIISVAKNPIEVLENKAWITELAGVQNYFHEEGFELISLNQAKETTFDKNESSCSGLFALAEKYLGAQIVPRELKNIQIVPSSKDDNRHSIANQWGAVRLANNCGYSSEEINYSVPNTLYFKYLNAKYGGSYAVDEKFRNHHYVDLVNDKGQIDFSKKHGKLKVLLIDDNAEKGWKNLLKKLFKYEVETCVSWEEVSTVNVAEFDLVFFDLYMPNPLSNKTESTISFKLISQVKDKYPEIPIIVFTASNKSWTYEEVLNIGADGVYIKESPDFAHDAELSKENFKNLIQTVNGVLSRYQTLRKYWEGIKYVTDNIGDFKKEMEEDVIDFSPRMIERMEMFYGLLKRGFEQREYNSEKFHLSQNTLALITLWSVLNEISEASYEKIDNNPSPSLPEKNHPDNTPIKPIWGGKETWVLKKNGEKLMYHEYVIDKDKQGDSICLPDGKKYKLKMRLVSNVYQDNRKSMGHYFDLTINHFDPRKTLGMQIAFILLSQHRLKPYDPMLENLGHIAAIRNKLFLTHGENDSNYYSTLEQDNPNTYESEIKNLFELISFLLTDKSHLNIN